MYSEHDFTKTDLLAFAQLIPKCLELMKKKRPDLEEKISGWACEIQDLTWRAFEYETLQKTVSSEKIKIFLVC